jgi:hypothetical protein
MLLSGWELRSFAEVEGLDKIFEWLGEAYPTG